MESELNVLAGMFSLYIKLPTIGGPLECRRFDMRQMHVRWSDYQVIRLSGYHRQSLPLTLAAVCRS